MKTNLLWDAVVIGGGPAGMMAAGRAAELGKKVLLLEKNSNLGKKLLITGGGRCNVTNNKPVVREMLAKYKTKQTNNDQFLFSAFSQFAVTDTLQFFNSRGMATKEEAEGRVFPASNTAQSVWDVLVKNMKDSGVTVRTGSDVTDISTDPDTKHISIKLKGGEKIESKSCVLATGGTSRPETGSTGDGFKWLKSLGHTIVENDFALVPIALSDSWAKKLGGVTLTDVKLTTIGFPQMDAVQGGSRNVREAVDNYGDKNITASNKELRHMGKSDFQNGQKHDVRKGKLLFTHFGVSGPTILNMSRDIGELLQYGEVTLSIDLFPTLDAGKVKEKLQTLLVYESNKKLKNILGKLVPSALVQGILELSQINGETPSHSVTSAERATLGLFLKNIPLHVTGLLGSDKAVVSSGGVLPEEVNFKTMESRLVPNLYLVGDVLHIDRPSGGYSLQLSWTTGYVAGSSIALG